LWRRRWRCCAGGELNSRSQIEITNFNWTQLVRMHTQNIFGLQIAMGDPLFVQKLQARSNFLDDLSRIMFGKANFLLDPIQQWTTVDFLEHQIKFLIILEKFQQLQNVWVASTVMEGFHLAKNASACMARYLVDDLDSVLEFGVNVDASLDRSVGTLAQDFAGQLVQFWKGEI
jgi:hypothetical protein